jgi:hypothetical protein
VICSQLPENKNASVTDVAEYLAAEAIEEHGLTTLLTWIEYYPRHQRQPGEYSSVRFSSWERQEACLEGVWRYRVGSPRWSSLHPEEVDALIGREHAQLTSCATVEAGLSASDIPGLARGPSADLYHFERPLGAFEALLRLDHSDTHSVVPPVDSNPRGANGLPWYQTIGVSISSPPTVKSRVKETFFPRSP